MSLRPEQQKALDELAEVWAKYPDLRLGQLIANTYVDSGSRWPDLYYVSDKNIAKNIKETMENIL